MQNRLKVSSNVPHTGHELELMLAGKKPMAVFYRAVRENFDETGGQNFQKYVKCGDFQKTIFYISSGTRPFKLVYSTYTIKGEEWRAQLYKEIKKIGQRIWCKDLEIIEGTLLGYSLEENSNHINLMYKS